MSTVARGTRVQTIVLIIVTLVLFAVSLVGDDRAPNLGGAPVGSAVPAKDVGTELPRGLPQSKGVTRHVAQDGSDGNPGTADAPWQTVQKALDALRPGERAIVRSGTYVADLEMRRSGRPDAPITIAARRGDRVVLRPASTSGDTYPIRFTDGAAYVRLQGFAIERATGISSTNVYFEGSVHHIELANNDIRLSQDQGVFAERTTHDLQIVGNRIHDNGLNHQPGQHQSHGIYLEGRDHLVANNVIHDQRFGFGIQIYPSNEGTLVVNNTVVRNAHSGIVLGGDEGVSDIEVRNNVLAYNAKYGVQMDDACPTDSSVEANVMVGNRSGEVQRTCSGVDVAGNVRANPQFVSPGREDFRLRPSSPAIDRADPAYAPRRDARGRRRPAGPGVDIGAYELAP